MLLLLSSLLLFEEGRFFRVDSSGLQVVFEGEMDGGFFATDSAVIEVVIVAVLFGTVSSSLSLLCLPSLVSMAVGALAIGAATCGWRVLWSATASSWVMAARCKNEFLSHCDGYPKENRFSCYRY